VKARMTRFTVAVLAAGVLALAFASAAVAENSSVETYAGGGGNIQTQVGSGDPSDPSATGGSGSLPFTGLDVGLALGGGLVLLAGGVLIARLTPRGERGS
jgi:hypothetical protein